MLTSWILKASFVFAAFGHTVDVATTQRCLEARTCKELNHYYARFDNPIGFTAAKIAIAGPSEVAIYDLSKEHSKLAIITNLAIGGAFTAIGVHNYRVTHK